MSFKRKMQRAAKRKKPRVVVPIEEATRKLPRLQSQDPFCLFYGHDWRYFPGVDGATCVRCGQPLIM